MVYWEGLPEAVILDDGDFINNGFRVPCSILTVINSVNLGVGSCSDRILDAADAATGVVHES
jgi:hypothetical protein